MSITGHGLGALGARLRDLASVPARASAEASESIAALIEEEFDAGTDPYGRPWQDLAESTLKSRPWRGPPPLTDTGVMSGGVRVAPLPRAGVGTTIPHPGAPHQTGWSGSQGQGPARPILPTGTMPRTWRRAIEAAVENQVRR